MQILNAIRKLWYKLSSDFDHNDERALTSKIDFHAYSNGLSLLNSYYFGFAGFFIILQSMVLKTPKFIKHLSYKFLTYFDLF